MNVRSRRSSYCVDKYSLIMVGVAYFYFCIHNNDAFLSSFSVMQYCSALVPILPRIFRYGVSFLNDRRSSLSLRQSSHCCSEKEEKSIAKDVLVLESEPWTLAPCSVLRNVRQSNVRPYLWQHFFCPPLSLVQSVESIFPLSLQSPRGIDVKLQWNASNMDHLDLFAERFLDLCDDELRRSNVPTRAGWITKGHRDEMCSDIAKAMQKYTQFCTQHARPIGVDLTFSLRIVCSYGNAATKCPQWHIDHVPCRYVQALLGPGCMFIENGENSVYWDRMNALYDDDATISTMDLSVPERNALLIDADRAVVGQAKEGEAILLMGNAWWKAAPEFRPAVHKSPHGQLAPWQGRILLTMDVVADDHPLCVNCECSDSVGERSHS